jgi:outer membrane protein assembly factor BamB
VVYVGGGDDYWYALDASSGAILWKVYIGDSTASGGYYNGQATFTVPEYWGVFIEYLNFV